MSEVWGGESENTAQVTVKLPNGSTRNYASVDGAMIRDLAHNEHINKYTVKIDGVTASVNDFPVTSGTIEIREYNEAKDNSSDLW